ncbi:MAG: sulfatase/phosphatase domain-containing protein, partial [Verrucomicrobiota bacterium]
GRVRDELTALGVRSNTMFWFTSDNGPEDGVNSPGESDTVRSIRSGGFFERKRSLFEGGVRVPGLLEWPDRIPLGRATNYPAFTSDYYPTILDVVGVAVPDQKPLDGVSLRPVIEGRSVTRSSPMGFTFNGDDSWVNDRYKLIDTGSGWRLYDLLADPTETNAVATAANIGSQPPAIQMIYSNMLAEYTVWENSVNTDLPYVHTGIPTVGLTTPSSNVVADFTITVVFSEPVEHLNLGEFAVANGIATNLMGSNALYTVDIIPSVTGEVSVHLPQGAAIDADGNLNAASAPLSVMYTNPSDPPTPPSVILTHLPEHWQTVDIQDDVPGDDDNNLTKFGMGTVNDGVPNPYTTTLYVRGSTGSDDRKVRAFVRFDLSGLTDEPVLNAGLSLNGHSLNDNAGSDLDLEVVAVAAPWSSTNAPLPTYTQATTGSVISGGSIISGLEPA